MKWNIVKFDRIDSTNSHAKMNNYQFPHGTVLVAIEQYAGRGSKGRNWISTPGQSLLFSILLKPNFLPMVIYQLSILSGAAVQIVLSEVGIPALLKWPNDVYVNGRKICGILTEFGGGLDLLDYVVIGFGINIKQESYDFPEILRCKATSLHMENAKHVNPDYLLERILCEFDRLYTNFLQNGFHQVKTIWMENNNCIGKNVHLQQENLVTETFTLRGLADDGSAILYRKDGTSISFYGGCDLIMTEFNS